MRLSRWSSGQRQIEPDGAIAIDSHAGVPSASSLGRSWTYVRTGSRTRRAPHGHTDRMDRPIPDDDPIDPFEAIVAAALDSLPEVFREQMGHVAIVIEDEPAPELLASLGVPGLFGLYQGVPRTAYLADHVMTASKITIYRNTHLRQYGDLHSLVLGVTDTVYHEVAHYFGISDDRLRDLARERRGIPR
jgi:predicted Zn-dependent protease with MMP-like domain